MSLCSDVRRVINAKAAIRAAIIAKGVDVPETDLIDKYAMYIDQISGTAKYYFDLTGMATYFSGNPHEAHGVYIDYGETINGYPAYSNKGDNTIKLHIVLTEKFIGTTASGDDEYIHYYHWVIGRVSDDGAETVLWSAYNEMQGGSDGETVVIENPLQDAFYCVCADYNLSKRLTAYTYSGGTGVYPGDADSDLLTEIYRIANAKAEMRTAIISKGVEVPESAMLETYPDYIAQIQPNGGNTDSGDDSGNTGEDNGGGNTPTDPDDPDDPDNPTPDPDNPNGVELESISISQSRVLIDSLSGTQQVYVVYNPADTYQTGVSWESADTSIAKVGDILNDSCVITGQSRGSTKVTATSTANSSISDSCIVDVLPGKLKVTQYGSSEIYVRETSSDGRTWYKGDVDYLVFEENAHIRFEDGTEIRTSIWKLGYDFGTTGGLCGTYKYGMNGNDCDCGLYNCYSFFDVGSEYYATVEPYTES